MNFNFVWKQSVSNLMLSSNCSPETSLSPLVAWLCLKDEKLSKILDTGKQRYKIRWVLLQMLTSYLVLSFLALLPKSLCWKEFNIYLGQCFSNFNVLMNHLEILLKCRFWFSRSRGGSWDLRFCSSNKLPGKANAAGLWNTFWVPRSKTNFVCFFHQ